MSILNIDTVIQINPQLSALVIFRNQRIHIRFELWMVCRQGQQDGDQCRIQVTDGSCYRGQRVAIR